MFSLSGNFNPSYEQVWLSLGMIFRSYQYIFSISIFNGIIYALVIRSDPSFKQTWTLMLCAKVGRNWPSASGKDFQKSSMYFHHFLLSPPGAKDHNFGFCLVWSLLSHSRIIHSYGNVTIIVKELQILSQIPCSWPLSNDGCSA